MSEYCKDCGKPYGHGIFLWLNDSLWKAIGCKEDDYLCAQCIISRIENRVHGCGYLYATNTMAEDKIWNHLKIKVEETEELKERNRKARERFFNTLEKRY